MFNSWLPYRNQLLTFLKKMYYLVFIYYLAITFLIVQDDIIYLYFHDKIPCLSGPSPFPPFFWLTIVKNNKSCRNVTIKVSRTGFWYEMFLYRTTPKPHLNPLGNAKPMLKSFWKSGHRWIYFSFSLYMLYSIFLQLSCLTGKFSGKTEAKVSEDLQKQEFRVSARDLMRLVIFIQPGDRAIQNVSSWISHTAKVLLEMFQDNNYWMPGSCK